MSTRCVVSTHGHYTQFTGPQYPFSTVAAPNIKQ